MKMFIFNSFSALCNFFTDLKNYVLIERRIYNNIKTTCLRTILIYYNFVCHFSYLAVTILPAKNKFQKIILYNSFKFFNNVDSKVHYFNTFSHLLQLQEKFVYQDKGNLFKINSNL